MEASDGNEGIMSKSPQNFSQDLHKVMAGALASSTVQNFKISLGNSSGKLQRPLRRAGDINLSAAICSPASAGQNLTISLGSSAGKVQRPLLKLKRAGDINLSAAFSSSVVAKMEVSGEMTSAGQNFTISLGSSAGKTQRPLSELRRAGDINLSTVLSPVVAKADASNIGSQQNITPNLHAVKAGAMAVAVDVNNIKISLGLGMSGNTAPANLSKDINSWKEASNSDSSLHQASRNVACIKLALLP